MMKIASELFFVVAVVLHARFVLTRDIPPGFIEKTKGWRETCMAETGATLEQINKGHFGQFVEDREFKCYLKCLFEQEQFFKDDHSINVGALVDFIPDEHLEEYEEAARVCSVIVAPDESDRCETAYLIHKCYHAQKLEDYFLI